MKGVELYGQVRRAVYVEGLSRREAARRIQAMVTYARARRCRRRTLLEWFGERLDRCAGCDRCNPKR